MKQLLIMSALVFTVTAHADAEPPEPLAVTVEQWLELQRSGQMASPYPQTASPAERERSVQRWLKSFEYAIPESFEQSQQTGGGS